MEVETTKNCLYEPASSESFEKLYNLTSPISMSLPLKCFSAPEYISVRC